MTDTDDKPTRQDALAHWPKHLSDGLLTIPDDARKQFATSVYAWLNHLTEIRDNGFVVPEECPKGGDTNQDEYDTVVYDLQMFAALLETHEQWQAAGGYGPDRKDGLHHFRHSPQMIAGLLGLPDDARTELIDVIDGTLFPLAEFQEHDYSIPSDPQPETGDLTYSQEDFEGVIVDWEMILALLEKDDERGQDWIEVMLDG